jgi:hypothetical protein
MSVSPPSGVLRWWVGLAALLPACGSVRDQGDPDAAPAADAWQRSCAPAQLITRVESADPFYGDDCVHGGWSLEALNGVTTPATAGGPDRQASVPPESITLGANPLDPSSTFAVHVSGSGQANTGTEFTYAQLAARLNTISETQIGTVDASRFTGIQFYGIINTGTLGARLTVGTLFTDPSGGMCTTTAGPKGCYDNPGAQLAVSTAWTKYQVPFASLTQLGFGNPSPLGADFPRSAILDLKWDIGIPMNGPTPPWELWIDDLTFY